MKFKEYRNKIYVKLLSVNLPATMTNKGSHVAKGLVDDLIQKYEWGEICRLEYVSKLGYRYRKNSMLHGYGHLVVKQMVKLLIVVNILKSFNKRRLHCLINKMGVVHVLRNTEERWATIIALESNK